MKVYERASRYIGYHAANYPAARLLYHLGARAYSRLTGDERAGIRKQINVLHALPASWKNLAEYNNAYPVQTASALTLTETVTTKKLIDRYDTFFVDIFGTCRDEHGFWREASGALRTMHRQGKNIVIVSNTADFSAEKTREQFREVGIDLPLNRIVTSGQLLGRELKSRGLVGAPILSIGNPTTIEYINAAGGKPVTDFDAEYRAILSSYLEKPLPEAKFAKLRERLLRQEMPVILANMDMFLPLNSGLIENLAFRLAEELTGHGMNELVEVGKPKLPIYEEALNRLEGKRPGKILCIGDTLWTDIQGAQTLQAAHPALQVDSLLVFSGTERKVPHYHDMLETYMAKDNIYPTYVLPRLEING